MFLNHPRGDLSRKLQHFLAVAPLDQIAAVPSNGFEPRFVEKLGGTGARPLVLCMRLPLDSATIIRSTMALTAALSIDFPVA